MIIEKINITQKNKNGIVLLSACSIGVYTAIYYMKPIPTCNQHPDLTDCTWISSIQKCKYVHIQYLFCSVPHYKIGQSPKKALDMKS